MIFEQNFKFQKKQSEIFEALIQIGEGPIEIEKDISMIYIGNKNNEIITKIKNFFNNNELLNNNNLKINDIQDELQKKEDNKKNILLFILSFIAPHIARRPHFCILYWAMAK